MTAVQDRYERTEILRMASNLTSLRHDPDNVLRHAKVLTDWLNRAADEDDRRDRLAALQRADKNRGRGVPPICVPRDDSEILISEAETYYDFMRAS